MRYFILICLFAGMTVSCIEEIVFDSGTSLDLIVVDGFITDAPGPYHVQVSRTASFKSVLEGGNENAVEGALVIIEDDLDNTIELREFEPGNYITPPEFVGIPGRTYTLHVNLNDEKQYISTPQLLTRSGAMSNISYEVFENTTGSVGVVQNPYKIRYGLDFTFLESDQFYRWDWEETYMFPTMCKISPAIECDTLSIRLVDKNVPIWCYVKDSLSENFINLAAARDYTTMEVQNHEFEVIDLSFKFFRRHSMNMIQYSISEEAYDYWQLIDQQVNASGSIFDPAPVQITGNIKNSSNEDEVVLGFFGAYGVANQRVFINATDIVEGVPGIECPDIITFHGEGPGSFCDDCRWWGNGTGVKPDYWVD